MMSPGRKWATDSWAGRFAFHLAGHEFLKNGDHSLDTSRLSKKPAAAASPTATNGCASM
jgi:hypothetical protein